MLDPSGSGGHQGARVGLVGGQVDVTAQVELTAVVGPVMPAAEGDGIVGVGGPAVGLPDRSDDPVARDAIAQRRRHGRALAEAGAR